MAASGQLYISNSCHRHFENDDLWWPLPLQPGHHTRMGLLLLPAVSEGCEGKHRLIPTFPLIRPVSWAAKETPRPSHPHCPPSLFVRASSACQGDEGGDPPAVASRKSCQRTHSFGPWLRALPGRGTKWTMGDVAPQRHLQRVLVHRLPQVLHTRPQGSFQKGQLTGATLPSMQGPPSKQLAEGRGRPADSSPETHWVRVHG